MTDEEKAEEYGKQWCELCDKKNKCKSICFKVEVSIQDYSEGLADGKPKWHDLRKDPQDLPKKNGKYIIHIKVTERMSITDTCDFFNGYFGQYINPIAWCELPMFEEGIC